MGNPDDFASLAVWLLSPLSKYITGQTYTVDGGINRSTMGWGLINEVGSKKNYSIAILLYCCIVKWLYGWMAITMTMTNDW